MASPTPSGVVSNPIYPAPKPWLVYTNRPFGGKIDRQCTCFGPLVDVQTVVEGPNDARERIGLLALLGSLTPSASSWHRHNVTASHIGNSFRDGKPCCSRPGSPS